MIKNIFVTKYYIKYFDDKEFTYHFPTPIYDQNGFIDEEILTLSLNKIKNILKVGEINLILLDPNSYAISLKNNETIEDASLYIDNSKFKIYDYIERCGIVLNIDAKTLNTIQEISRDLKLKINLFSFIDYCYLNITSDNKDEVFYIIDKNFYCFIIFEDGKLIKYFYDDRSFYNNRAIENLKVSDKDISEEEIFENLDFEITASATSSIFSIINDPSEFIFNKHIYNSNDNIEGYLNSTGFNNFKDINFNNKIDAKDALIKSRFNNRNNNIIKYLIPVFLALIFGIELFYYKILSSDVNKLQDLVIEAGNNNLNKIAENDRKKDNQNNEEIINEYNDIINSNIILNSNKIFNLLSSFSTYSEIISAHTDEGFLYVEIVSDQIDKRYESNIIKQTTKNGKKIYELKFEVIQNEAK